MKSVCRFIFGVVFIISAIAKFISIDQFELYVYSLNIFSLNASIILSRILIVFEFSLGCFILLKLFFQTVWRVSFILLISFTVFLLVLQITRPGDECNCFGKFIKMNPLVSLLKNTALLILLFLFKNQKTFTWKGHRLFAALFPVAVLAFVFIKSPPDFLMYKPKNIEKQSFDYSDLSEKGKEKFATFFASDCLTGKKVVCFYSTSCGFCKMAARKISIMAQKHQFTENVIYIFTGDTTKLPLFYTESESMKFPSFFIPPRDFLKLTRNRMPKIFLLDEGNIVRIYGYRDLHEKEIADFFTTQ